MGRQMDRRWRVAVHAPLDGEWSETSSCAGRRALAARQAIRDRDRHRPEIQAELTLNLITGFRISEDDCLAQAHVRISWLCQNAWARGTRRTTFLSSPMPPRAMASQLGNRGASRTRFPSVNALSPAIAKFTPPENRRDGMACG